MTIRRWFGPGCTSGLLLVCLAGCGAHLTRDVAVDRYDVRFTVLAEGSLEVLETITVHAEAADGARFSRDVAPSNVDRILDVELRVDGRSPDPSSGEARLDRTGALRATWPIAPADRSPHILTLRYRLAGALPVQGTRGILRRPVLPVNRAYAVGAARVDLVVPPGSVFAAGPDLEGARAPLARRPDGATAELGPMAPGDRAVIAADIVLGSLNMAEPEWQSNAVRGQHLMPAFVSAGACLVVVGLGIVLMVRLQYPRPMAGDADPAAVTPEGISPAMATVLTSLSQGVQIATNSRAGVATGLGLIRRRLDRAVAADLVSSGFLDEERLSVARGLRATGLVAIGLALAGAVVCEVTLSRFGVWPMAVPLGLAVMGVLFGWAGARLPLLSRTGEDAASALARQYTSRL
jgi:hypothetical protein